MRPARRMHAGRMQPFAPVYHRIWWVLSSVWRTLTYQALLHYLQSVSMWSAISPPPFAVTTADGIEYA